MLYQDTLTGLLHETPDSQVSGWGLAEDPQGVGEPQMVYDGLGNPLGWGFLKSIGGLVKKAAPFAAMLGPYGQIISRAIPIVSRALRPTAQALQQQVQQDFGPPPEAQPQLAGGPVGYPYIRPGTNPQMYRPSSPVTWRPQSPYMLQPRSYSPTAVRPPVAWTRPPAAQPPAYYSPMQVRPPIPAGWRQPHVPELGPKPRRVYMRCAVWRGPGGLVPVNPGPAPVAPPAAAAPTGGARRYHRRHRR
jgi:hypothetical protein